MIEEGPPPLRAQSAGWLSTQRFTLAAEALLTETRDPLTGVWSPGRSVFYDEIRAIYTFRAPDWGYLVVAALYGVVGSLLILLAGLATEWGRTAWIATVCTLVVLLGALAAFRVFVRQQQLVRVDTTAGPLAFASRDTAFLAQLRGRLVEAAPVAAAAEAAPPAAVGGGRSGAEAEMTSSEAPRPSQSSSDQP